MHKLTVALVGNPNCGKTTLFNALTGARQRVGNWSGVTVEKKTGNFCAHNTFVDVVDLPGVYSLSVSSRSSIDETIACRYILSRQADVVVNIIDASNLERNLYLTCQLLEMRVPVILAVNMMDVAKLRGIELNLEELSRATGCPAVPLISRKGRGVEHLKDYIIDYKHVVEEAIDPLSCWLDKNKPHTEHLPQIWEGFSKTLSNAIDVVANNIDKNKAASLPNKKWLAVRLLENDEYAKSLVHEEVVLQGVVETQQHIIEEETDEEVDSLLANVRYRFIGELIEKCKNHAKGGKNITNFIDKIVLNRWLGLPIFLLIMFLMFEFSITIGGIFQPLFDQVSKTIFVTGAAHLGFWLGLPAWLVMMFSHGVGLGINTVLTFIPQIGGLFLFLSFLEDSGYMARAAFVMDKLMQAIGLPGKSFVPLLIGFGCNVPAIMAARTLEHKKDRLLTIMMTPFMSCSARLAIFAVFSTAFFPQGGALVVFLLYLIGMLVAILTGFVVKNIILKGDASPFVMELPIYHMPHLKSMIHYTWHRLEKFIVRAGKVIVPVCFVLGSLNAIQIGHKLEVGNGHNSILAKVGKIITPAFKPMGISEHNWPAVVGLATGTMAKEVVIGTLNTLYTKNQTKDQLGNYNFGKRIKRAVVQTYDNAWDFVKNSFSNPFGSSNNSQVGNMSQAAIGHLAAAFDSPFDAFVYMLFVLLYVPCISTIAVTAKEAGKGWAALSTIWSISIAYVFAVVIYQLSKIAAHPIYSSGWIVGVLGYLGILILTMRFFVTKSKLKKVAFVPHGCGRCAKCK